MSILYPLILLKTRLQSARRSQDIPSHVTDVRCTVETPLDIARGIVKRDGIVGLYQGLEAQILKGIISQSVTFSMKQR